ncbi:MAG: hypothetical protein M1830_003253, partial [Pleopsidium flavum]
MASLHTPTDPWLAARSRYMEDLNNEEKEAFATASIENLFYSASAAQKGHKETSRSRAISSKLEPFVGAIDQYGRALDVYSNTYSLVMGPLWGSIRVLLQVAQAFEKYFEKLIDMFSRIGDILPRFQVYQSLFPSHERLLQAISIAYLDIIYFCMDAKKTFRKLKRSTTIYLTLKLVWKDFSKGFEGTLDKFRNHVKNIEKEAGVSNMLEASDEQALARANRAEMERKRKVEERDLMLSQLSSIRYADKHLRERKRRHPGTGTWLTKTLEFKEWKMRDRSACLWCYGIPGSGKTVLASSLIDTLSIDNANKDITIQYLTSHDIISKDITTQELAIAYYYCDFSDPKSLDARNILGTIIRQLLNKIIIPLDLKQQLDQLYRPGIRAAANDELLAILVAVVKHFSKVYIFVDGLDECRKEERFSVLSMINQLTQSECTAVKILITSQEVADVSTSLKGHPRLQISVDKNSSDIASFIEETIKANIKSGALVVHDPSLELNIISALVDGAQGMFLWVSFQIADLCDATSEFEIRETLQNLPKGMAATYARILQKIRSIRANISLAQRIFKWIICAKRPLLIAELTEAIAFGPTDRSWDARKIPDATRSIQACGNLVVFDEDDKTVRLAHHSVRQFLLEPPTQDPISEFHFQLSQANVEAGELCVAYLSFSDFETQLTIPSANILRPASNVPGPVAVLDSVRSSSSLGHVKSGMVNFRQHMRTGSKRQQTPTFDLGEFLKLRKSPPPSLREKYLFLNYAIENWIGHTSNFSEDNTTMWKSFKYLAMDKPMPFDTRSWPDTYVSGGLPYTALFRWAVDAGHVPLLKLLLRLPTGHDIHAYYRQDVDEGRSVVLNASRCGHANVIKLLAQQGCIDDRGGKPLVEAAENGYDFAVRLLLEYGLCLEAKTEALEKA